MGSAQYKYFTNPHGLPPANTHMLPKCIMDKNDRVVIIRWDPKVL